MRLTPEIASVIAMVVNLGAYAAEIARAGIEGTPKGQVEAARSLALNEAQVFLRVVLPPSLARVWPALVSQIVIVMLGSAVCGQIAAQELSYAANLIQSRNFRAFESYPTHGTPFASATTPAAGLSTFCPITSTPAAMRFCAAAVSFGGEYHAFVQMSFTRAFGLTACAPSVKALMWRTTSGMPKGTTYPMRFFFVAAPAAMPER